MIYAIGLLGYLFIGLFFNIANGQTMSNKDYIIKMQGFNAISGTTTNTNYRIRSTAGELGTALEGVNFKIKPGFENIESVSSFSVSLSSDIIDFGLLTPTNPIIRTVDLSISSLSTFGYSVIASEDHALKSNTDNIPDTTCDNGECTQEKAEVWINTLSFGFGYRCDNIIGFDCDSSFSKPNFYKHFANISNAQSPQSVMLGIGSKNKKIQMSYKVNISGNQTEGIYSNTVTYIAVPNF